MVCVLKGAVSQQPGPIWLVWFWLWFLKGCVTAVQSSLVSCPITRPYLLLNLTLKKKLLVNDKITASWQTNMYPERYI